VALERFEFSIEMASLSFVQEWVYWTLRSIKSPVFNEFVIWVLNSPGMQRRLLDYDCWKAVDTLLEVLAKRNPDFRVVIMKSGDWWTFTTFLPLARSNGLITFRSPLHQGNVENRFSKLGFR